MARSALAAVFGEVQRAQPWILRHAANEIHIQVMMRSG